MSVAVPPPRWKVEVLKSNVERNENSPVGGQIELLDASLNASYTVPTSVGGRIDFRANGLEQFGLHPSSSLSPSETASG